MTDKHGRVPKPKGSVQTNKLPGPKVPETTDNLSPLFKFSLTERRGRYSLGQWTSRDLDALVDCLQTMEAMTWLEIRATGGPLGERTGLAYTPLKNPRGLGFSPEVKPFEVRVCQGKRLIAHRDKQTCYVLRFDRGHDTTGR